MLVRNGGKLMLVHCWLVCKLVQSLMGGVEVQQKIKMELTYDPAILLLDVYWKETSQHKNTNVLVFYGF
jgi:hypothetical protein